MCHNLKGNKLSFQNYKIYYKESLLEQRIVFDKTYISLLFCKTYFLLLFGLNLTKYEVLKLFQVFV